jgi:GntR family transcriptional regulator
VSVRPALAVRDSDPIPPYEQLRRQLEDMIRSGVLPAGERLPPLRQLAGDLGLAVGTVARTYRELEATGLVVSRRGAGTRVAARLTPMTTRHLDAALDEQAEAYVHGARLLGASHQQIAAALTRALEA